MLAVTDDGVRVTVSSAVRGGGAHCARYRLWCSLHNCPSPWTAPGLAMHAGSSVIEVMPVHQRGCPCDMYKTLYTFQGHSIFHYQMRSTNASNAVSVEARKKGTYNSDLFLPWTALRLALDHVVKTGGQRNNYRFLRFPF